MGEEDDVGKELLEGEYGSECVYEEGDDSGRRELDDT